MGYSWGSIRFVILCYFILLSWYNGVGVIRRLVIFCWVLLEIDFVCLLRTVCVFCFYNYDYRRLGLIGKGDKSVLLFFFL